MTVLRVVLAVGAFLCGVRAMAYWAILQLGGVRPAERDGIALVVCCSAFLFVILSSASAYLRERASGARAIAVKPCISPGLMAFPPLLSSP